MRNFRRCLPRPGRVDFSGNPLFASRSEVVPVFFFFLLSADLRRGGPACWRDAVHTSDLLWGLQLTAKCLCG